MAKRKEGSPRRRNPTFKELERQRNYEYAVLIEHFHFTPQQIAQMTRYQIQELCFHYRNREGKLCIPKADADKPSVEKLQQVFNFSEQDKEKLKAFLGEKNAPPG